MRFKNIILIFGLLILGIASFAQTIIPGGYVSGNWDSTGSPYVVEGTITIHRDSALVIGPGCELHFHDSAYLDIDGYIDASGTAGDSIIFTTAEHSWMGIRLEYSDTSYQGNLLFRYCVFKNAKGGGEFPNGGAFSIVNRNNITIFNSSFYDNYVNEKGGAIYLENSDIQLKLVDFVNNETSLVLEGGKGGAIYVVDSDYILENLTFIGNRSAIAGALYSDNSDLDLRSCDFFDNSSHAGGGALVCHNSGKLYVDRCVFDGNVANGSGGAIALLEAIEANFRNSSITNNVAATQLFLSDGGGILVTPYDNEIELLNCIVSGNDAGDFGGGIYSTSATSIVDCLFHSNRAELDEGDGGGGGALLLADTYGFILNSTFSGNKGENASSIYCQDVNLSMVNSILWDDTISGSPKIFMDQYEDPTSILVKYCDIEGGMGVIRGTGDYEIDWSDGNFSADPLFNSPGSNYSLSNESPCIDTGMLGIYSGMLPLLDLAGNPRVFREKIDLGCYENQFPFGIIEIRNDLDFLVYPNPASDRLVIRSNIAEEFSGRLRITDMLGRSMTTADVRITSYGKITQDVSQYPPGIYILNIESVQLQKELKFIVK